MAQVAIRLTNPGFKTNKLTFGQSRQTITIIHIEEIKLDAG